MTVQLSARNSLSLPHAFFNGCNPVSQASFRAARPTLAAPARSPDMNAVLMVSHVSPAMSLIELNASAKSPANSVAPALQASHAPVSCQTMATTPARAAPTRNAGDVIAAHMASETTLTAIIDTLSRPNIPMSAWIAIAGASMAVFSTKNAVESAPTVSAMSLSATPAAIKAAPSPAIPAMTLTAMITTSLWAAIHSATWFRTPDILLI